MVEDDKVDIRVALDLSDVEWHPLAPEGREVDEPIMYTEVRHTDGQLYTVFRHPSGLDQVYTEDEMEAFGLGVKAGEFDPSPEQGLALDEPPQHVP